MSVGDGIFGGAVFIGLVVLYVATKDRWKWRRIMIWVAAALVLPIIGGAGWAAYEKYQSGRPTVQQELWGLRIGMDEPAVLFAKGAPTQKKDDQWAYVVGDLYYIVKFGSGKVSHIRAATPEEKEYSLPSLQQIGWTSTLEEIEAKFGKPDDVSVSPDMTKKTVTFQKFGVFFELRKNNVIMVGVLGHDAKPLRYAEPASGRKD